MCSGHLSRFIPSLRGPLSNLDLLSITFEELRIAVNAICQTMEVHGGHQYDNDVSSNSTILTSIPRIMKQSGNDDANTLVDSVIGDFAD